MVVVLDEYSKSLLFDGCGRFVDDNEQMGGNRVAIEELWKGLANDIVIVEGFGNER